VHSLVIGEIVCNCEENAFQKNTITVKEKGFANMQNLLLITDLIF